MLGNLVLVDDSADPQANLALLPQPSALDHPLHLGQLPLGGRDQRDACLCTVLGDERVPTNHQPLPGVVTMGDLHQIALIEQRRLDRPILDEGAHLVPLEGRDPPNPRESLLPSQFVDLPAAECPAIPHHRQSLHPERLAPPLHFSDECGRVGRVPRVDGRRHRTAPCIGQQTELHLQPRCLPAPSQGRQRARLAVVVNRRQVVKRQSPDLKMSARQLALNPLLAFAQPVKRCVQIVLVGVSDPELLGNRRCVPPPTGGELAVGR